MCITVGANGYGPGKGTHVNIGAYLMKGDHDDSLVWPFCGSVVVQLLNCRGDHCHCQCAVDFNDASSKESTQQVVNRDRAVMGRIKYTFCSHASLSYDLINDTQYLVQDTLQFKILQVYVYSRVNKAPKWRHPSTPSKAIAEYTMSDFAKHKTAQDDWYSPRFYGDSYCFRLLVKADSYGSGKRTHVGVCIVLSKGTYDENLSWPFEGSVTVQMLNWRADHAHKVGTIPFVGVPSSANSRVLSGEQAEAFVGLSKFIPCTDLQYNPRHNTQFLEDDCIQLRVVSVTSR